jgi:ABC-2 type transport system ATP-binding protein
VRALDQAGITVDDAGIRQPSLDDVFFALTGRPSLAAQAAPAGTQKAAAR